MQSRAAGRGLRNGHFERHGIIRIVLPECVAHQWINKNRGPWQVTVGRNGDGTTTNLDRTNGDVVAAAFRLEATTVDPFGKAPVDQLPVECWHW